MLLTLVLVHAQFLDMFLNSFILRPHVVHRRRWICLILDKGCEIEQNVVCCVVVETKE